MDDKRYILPITRVAVSFDEAKKDYDEKGSFVFWGDRMPTSIEALARGTRNMIVGEPGVGKTELIKRINSQLEKDGYETNLIPLRSIKSIHEIDDFMAKPNEKPKALLLDALDETPAAFFTDILEKIKEVSESNPDVAVYISARWVFAQKYSSSFSGYRFITVMPFTSKQMNEYLVQGGRTEADVNALFRRVMQFSHGRLIIQVPRYLFLFEDYLEGKDINTIDAISRDELFEHFIYKRLEKEAGDDEKKKERLPILKRTLEKLALVMEIYQTNAITREDLVTFFDDLESDLKVVFLTQFEMEDLLSGSVLQVSKEGTDKIEFDNAEFQEYLAAKEITRLPEPRRAAFSFVTDPDAGDIYPSWFNALSFFVDMEPEALEQIVDYSGMRSRPPRVLDEGFITFLSRVSPASIPSEVRQRIFMDVLGYHEASLQWISGPLTSALPGFFDPKLESFLKEKVEEAEVMEGAQRYVRLGNLAYIIAYLYEAKKPLDNTYWRPRLVSYALEVDENTVLARHALVALGWLGDESVIEELFALNGNGDNLIIEAFVSMCRELNPNNPRSVESFISTVSRNDLHGRYGLYEITEQAAIKQFLRAYNENDRFRREFLDDTSIFKDQDSQLIDHIRATADEEMRELVMEAIVNSAHYSVAHTRGKSAFVAGLMSFLKEGDPDFIPKLIRKINAAPDGNTSLYFAQEFFVDLLTADDVPGYVAAMRAADRETWTMVNTLARIKFSGREDADAVYEAGRELLAEEYQRQEEIRAQPAVDHDHMHDERIISEFRLLLEPAPGQYMTSVFHEYNSSADKLETLMSDEEKNRFDELITGSALNHDPAQSGLTITEQSADGNTRTYTASGAAHTYGDALIAAKRRGIDITPFRNNLARFIPFAHNEELKTVFELVPNFTPQELEPMVGIYRDHNTDLWRYQPDNFIEFAEKYNFAAAAPILRDFVREGSFRKYDRVEALSVAELLRPDAAFLREVFNLYRESENVDENAISNAANGLLITRHADAEAIRWRVDQLKGRAAAHREPQKGYGVVRDVTPFDDEMRYSKEFAKPLMELDVSGFEDVYLGLIDDAMEVWALGAEYHGYAQYLWDIVFAYFDNLKKYKLYRPLRLLEKKILSVSDSEGANWMAARMSTLRRSYLAFISKPLRIAEAIRKYNEARHYSDRKITNSADLFRHLEDAIQTDLRNWVESEGAYQIILMGGIYKSKHQEYEKLIQKTLKAQIGYIMIKRGFELDLTREADLLDDKRADVLVRYGFVGPIVLEVKLTSNGDLKARDIKATESYASMAQYMRGYGASHGIFLIIDNATSKRLSVIEAAYEEIKGVTPVSLKCQKFALPTAPKHKKAAAKKKVAKKTAKKSAVKKPK